MRGAFLTSCFVLLSCLPTLSGCQTMAMVPAPSYMRYEGRAGVIDLEGWLSTSGEPTLYDSQEARNHHLIYPYCVTLIDPGNEHQLSDLNGDHVIVSGLMVSKSDLSEPVDEERSLSTGSVYDGAIVDNYCSGRFLIRIEAIHPAP